MLSQARTFSFSLFVSFVITLIILPHGGLLVNPFFLESYPSLCVEFLVLLPHLGIPRPIIPPPIKLWSLIDHRRKVGVDYPLRPTRRTTDMLVIDKQAVAWPICNFTRLYSESDLTLPVAFNRLTAFLTIVWIPTHTCDSFLARNPLWVYFIPLFQGSLFFFGSGM